jgi:hypothetical protein
VSKTPTHGFTRHGHAVHAKTTDHLPSDTAYQRFNKKVALAITNKVGTMTCTWIFAVLALTSLPAVLVAANVVHFHSVIASAGFILVVSWVAQSFLQLILLPAIMVGQNLQSAASDVRAAKTFEDVETVLDRLDEKTEGGIKAVLDRIDALEKGAMR